VTDTWDPRQYDKCQRERDQPFVDLLALIRPFILPLRLRRSDCAADRLSSCPGWTRGRGRWTKGTRLTKYARRLPADLFEQFVEQYRERLVARLERERPFFYPFKRILCWGQRSA
jgi:trans-aconitate methyltransferase